MKGRKISKNDLLLQMGQQIQRQAEAEKRGKKSHGHIPVPKGMHPEFISNDSLNLQIKEYEKQADELTTQQKKDEFWFKKAKACDEAIVKQTGSLFLHTALMKKHIFLRKIFLITVDGALEHDKLIQYALKHQQYDICKQDGLGLRDPLYAAAMRITPLFRVYKDVQVSEEEKSQLVQAMRNAFPQDSKTFSAVLDKIFPPGGDKDLQAKRFELFMLVRTVLSDTQKKLITADYEVGSSSSNPNGSNTTANNTNSNNTSSSSNTTSSSSADNSTNTLESDLSKLKLK